MPLPSFQKRRYEEELMDQPETSRPEFEEALKDIRWVNRNLGGTRTLVEEVAALLKGQPEKTFSILDLGTGSADIPLALVEWAAENQVNLSVTALDIHPTAVDVSRQQCVEFPQITVVKGDALASGFANQQFDVVVSSMFMHHLEDGQAVTLLQEMARIGRLGFVVNDLERHPLAWLGITLLGGLTGKGRIFMNDAPLSVLRGFTAEEAKALLERAGLSQARVTSRRPYRLVIKQRHA